MDSGGRPPVAYPDERPFLREDCVWVWEAFGRLSKQRMSGFGVGAIPVDKITEWYRVHGLDDDEELQELWYLIDRMDTYFLRAVSKK